MIDQIKVEKDNSIGIITLNRPDQKNAITSQIAAELKEIRSEIGFGSEINVIILTGEGRDFFSNGVDGSEYSKFTNAEEFVSKLSTASTMGSFDRPTIAAINGDAIGQGLELALACDIRIASESARFAMPQAAQGEMAFDGGTQRLPRLIGRTKAMEMILLGRTVDSDEALRTGLVNRVVEPDEVMPAALEMARDLSAKGPISLRYAKEAIHKGLDMTLEQGLRLEADLYFLIHSTEDRTEGIKAFRDKKKPDFKGK
ncbi:MAG: enoyl-CoA hydratase/isomerase family protein [Deltaproteobacteria bacterium]|nr:enoyl-CoA hydratase/isomerase family protein [Deltaproteobacteria bacterium]MBW2053045.1 enoyl-CoA hydratase/isomerase family protein [Deltaproteobacteria bacterium]MBW2141264.1 enoyl-CoA hydratase/isomerase family protein [Deltaproteobacteria bacterium]MBW2322834.1 enoyl-CoA hydratase/isomerase family protein [Deltaproteobacteria bacterium]